MSKKDQNSLPYLHGYSPLEQDRLRRQAEFAEHTVYKNVDLTEVQNLLEVGCGVGAQTSILLRRFPKIKVTGIDLNEEQLAAAKASLEQLPLAKGRYTIQKMDAQNMDFSAHSFDGAFLCWILEHVPDPLQILNEVRRVLRPGGVVYITEVVNSSFFLDPYSPNLWKYWMAFNDYQFDGAGDPFVGAKLGNFLSAVGFQKIKTEVITWHLDNRQPEKRRKIIEYWAELLLSAADQLVKAGYVTQEVVDAGMLELKKAQKNPNAVFLYSFMQAQAIAPV
jgi:ubiquinone/menaquinone biosynthesis C-methylase UbiE